jgi:hypothetical protein
MLLLVWFYFRGFLAIGCCGSELLGWFLFGAAAMYAAQLRLQH